MNMENIIYLVTGILIGAIVGYLYVARVVACGTATRIYYLHAKLNEIAKEYNSKAIAKREAGETDMHEIGVVTGAHLALDCMEEQFKVLAR